MPTEHTIHVYTDGSTKKKNPSLHTGAGIVLLVDDEDTPVLEASLYLGQGTNNTAELNAIRYGALLARRLVEHGHVVTKETTLTRTAQEHNDIELAIYSDSKYAIGVLSGQYTADKNVDLIDKVLGNLYWFPNRRFEKVKGHTTVKHNNRADELAARGAYSETKKQFYGPLAQWARMLGKQ